MSASRPAVLVSLDLVRAGVAVLLPFVSEIWQIYPLIFVLQAASAAFTPTSAIRPPKHPPADCCGDRPALYAAQFALSHACWLITYPLAGWLGKAVGLEATFVILALLAAAALAAAIATWPAENSPMLAHPHDGLSDDDPHWGEGVDRSGSRHAHAFVIDERHSQWLREP